MKTVKITAKIINKLVQENRNVNEYLPHVRKMSIDSTMNILGIQKGSQGYNFNFFNRKILFDGDDFIDLSGEDLQPAIKNIFCQYLINSPQNQIQGSGRLVTFREFSGAGPLFSRVVANTNGNRNDFCCTVLFSIVAKKPLSGCLTLLLKETGQARCSSLKNLQSITRMRG